MKKLLVSIFCVAAIIFSYNYSYGITLEDIHILVDKGFKEDEKQMILEDAEKGNAEDQFILGLMYYKGEGKEQNYKEGIKWIKKSADSGYVYAQYTLGDIYYIGKNRTEAAKWYKKAADQNDVLALLALGNLYEKGDGVQQNKSVAKDLYKRSCDGGCDEGCEAYEELNEDNMSTNSSELRGPIIKGFQLGMTVAQVKKIAEKNRLDIVEDKEYNKRQRSKNFKQIIKLNKKDKTLLRFEYFEDNDINLISVTDDGLTELYNAKGTREGFLQAFLKNYNIPKDKVFEGDFCLKYMDNKNGWSISFYPTLFSTAEIGSFQIEKIEKVEKFKF